MSQLSLFDQEPDYAPGGRIERREKAEIFFAPGFFARAEADRLFAALLKGVEWQQDHMQAYGKLIPLPRLSAWYGDGDKPYTYSGINLQPKPWTKELSAIKDKLEEQSEGATYSSVLLNRYRDGSDYVGWHQDNERELGKNPIIGSVNFGATRRFQLRRKDKPEEKMEFELEHGTLLIMRGETQHYWQHQVPKTSRPTGERINLTFRKIF